MAAIFSRVNLNFIQCHLRVSYSQSGTVTPLLSCANFFAFVPCFVCCNNRRTLVSLKKCSPYKFLSQENDFSFKVQSRHSLVEGISGINTEDNSRRSLVTVIKNVDDLDHRKRPISLTDIKRVIRLHGMRIDEGHACIEASFFPLCFEIDRRKKPSACKIFVNKTTGFFVCNKCESSGSWNLLEQALSSKRKGRVFSIEELSKYGLISHSYIPESVSEKLNTALCVASILSTESSPQLPGVQKLMRSLGLERVNISVLKQLETKVGSDLESLIFPLRASQHGEVRGIKILRSRDSDFANKNVGMKNEDLSNSEELNSVEEETIPPNDCQGLFGWIKTGTKKEAILVTSVRDVLAISSSIPHTLPLCLPYGSSSLPQSLLPALEPFTKITLWFGRNHNGLWDDPRMYARKLGEDRCYFVRPTDSQPSAWEGMQQGAALGKVLSGARCIAHPCITTFETLREDVLAEIQNVEKVKGVKWRRFPALTRILHGHRRGELTILTGPTGSGKTTFMSEYSLDLSQQGVSTLWGSFEIRNTRLARSMLQQMVGEPLEGKSMEEFNDWADQFSRLPLYFMTFHGQQSLKVVMEAVSHAAYVHDIAHVVVDNVQFMLGMGESENLWGARNPGVSDRFWRQDMVIAAFRKFATSADCHVSLVIHPRKERDCEDLTSNSIFGGVKASQEADNVLIIQDKRLASIRGKKYLQVAKNRYSGDLGVMALEFDKESLSYGKKKKASLQEKHSESSEYSADILE